MVFKHDFIRCVDFTRITASFTVYKFYKLQITSQITSHIEYLIHMYYILVLIL